MNLSKKYHIGILATHPIQYYIPWYAALARHAQIDLKVFYCHRQSPEGQARAGFGVAFDWDTPLYKGYEYHFLNNKSLDPNVFTFFGCDTPKIKAIIHDSSFDAFIVHGWNAKSFWQAISACWATGTPIFIRGDSHLFTKRSLVKRWVKYPIYRWFIPRFDAYLFVGKWAKEYYLYYGGDENKMYFTPHAVDNDYFAEHRRMMEPQREYLREKWGIPAKSIVFLFVGKLIPKKRPLDFIKAIQSACGRQPGIFGLIVGDGPLRFGLEIFVKKTGIPVRFSGFLNQGEIPKAYTASDVLILPSDARETWGLAVNEAMASGLPAILSDQAGSAADLIMPGQTGEIFSCGNITQLSRSIVDFAKYPERLQEMAKKVRHIISKYSIEEAVSGTLNAISDITNMRRKERESRQRHDDEI